MAGPLEGVRVLEFVGIGPGPYAAMLLADLGAEVIRVDRPGGADPYTRHVLARGRRSLVADLKDPADLACVLALADGADALIEGYRPGVMERLGLGPEPLLARNPRLVYGRITGWGQEGPLARVAGHDLTYIAVTGALAAIGPAERPCPPLNLVGDFGGGGMFLVAGLLAALLNARSSGRGQVVDAAICDGTAHQMAMFCDFAAQGVWQERRAANLLDGGAPFYRTFECADGAFIAVGALEPQFYALLCQLIGEPSPPPREPGDWPGLHARLEALFRTRTRAEWCALLEATDACVAPVLSLSEAARHPHLAARGTYLEQDGLMQPAPAPRFSATPCGLPGSVQAPVPVRGAGWNPREG